MRKNIRKPNIRFTNYNNDWEQRKLGDVATVRTGYPFDSNEFNDMGEYLVITNGNVQNDSPTVDKSIGNRISINNSALNEYVLNKNDILVTMDGTVGRTAKVVDERQILAQRVGRLTANLDAEFLYQSLNTGDFFKKMTLISHGGTIKHISLSEIGGYLFFMPLSIKEQNKIGEFFSSLDNLITLHQRKLNCLESAKTTFLNMIFPKKDANVPEFRFAKYNDVWEQRKLEDIADRYDNLRIPVTASNRIPGSTPYYGANGIQDYVDGYTHDGEYVLIAEDGANDLNNYPVHLVKGKVWVNNHAHVISAIDNIANNLFVSNSFKTLNLVPYLTGGSRAKLNAETMMKLNLKIPSIEEQQIIGAFFESLDNLITLHQLKLERLENIKKYYLKHMFV